MSKYFIFILIVFIAGFFIPERFVNNRYHPDNENVVVENTISSSWNKELTEKYGLAPEIIQMALKNISELKEKNLIKNNSILTIIDFSRPSTDKRLFILDLKNEKVIKNTLVAHGVNSGNNMAESFSNNQHSNKSSLGFYITKGTYSGKHGYSLRIDGKNIGLNNNALKRDIVIHGADYVSEDFIKKNGRIGRSFGCPAVPVEENQEIIDLIKNGTCLYIYHPVLNPTD
ncbi:MAG: hypothetical protein A2041_00485 [Bacteroidetes bacterium GWA2_31_9b]|nr:MAG: hypothetical protein A2041_00485 [Bacteroidetes bacterium GWA2_31_9b]